MLLSCFVYSTGRFAKKSSKVLAKTSSSNQVIALRSYSETESDEDGFFQFQLDSNTYSIFTIEKGKYYANGGDGYGGINPVLIDKDSITFKNLSIDYAVY